MGPCGRLRVNSVLTGHETERINRIIADEALFFCLSVCVCVFSVWLCVVFVGRTASETVFVGGVSWFGVSFAMFSGKYNEAELNDVSSSDDLVSILVL